MSKIDEMIARLCPDGVEYKALADLFDMRNGYTPSRSHKDYWENGTIPWFRMNDIRENGRILFDSTEHITSKGVKKSGLFPKGTILMATTATIGEHAILKMPALANQQFTGLTVKKEFANKLNEMFVYYYMFKAAKMVQGMVVEGSFPSVNMKKFGKIIFPIPPLEIQEEIVRVLGSFTELEAELERRKAQYAYYRDNLFNALEDGKLVSMSKIDEMIGCFCPDGVEHKELGALVEVSGGYAFKNKDYKTEGIRIVRIGDVQDGKLSDRNMKFGLPPKEVAKRYSIHNNDILVSLTGNVGRTVYIEHKDLPLLLNQRVASLRPFPFVNAKYVYYCLQKNDFKRQAEVASNGSAQANLSSKWLSKYCIPVPPLEIQKKIVQILDSFDQYANDISGVLPAEIKIRRQQYEYYRDKLLDLPRKAV